MKKLSKPELSIVILSYNTKELLGNCLSSVKKNSNETPLEVIVSDNNSSDGSVEMVKNDFPWVKLIKNDRNLGFAAGNNVARKHCKGEYVLFLNSDTIIKKGVLAKTVFLLAGRGDVGVVTCKMILLSGELDKDARRSFPTPWITLTHFFGIDRIFSKSKLFARYWYGYLSPEVEHEIDIVQGAYFLTRKKILDEVGWFDEDYFLDGEDVDLSWQIKKAGWKLIYYPEVSIIHIKKASKKNLSLNFKQKLRFKMTGINSMEIFYRKNLWNRYPILVNYFVILGIKIIKLIRYIKVVLNL